MKSDDDELMGTAEIAALLGVSRQRVLQLDAEDNDFPPPVAVLNMGKVWRGAQVRQWSKRNGRSADNG